MDCTASNAAIHAAAINFMLLTPLLLLILLHAVKLRSPYSRRTLMTSSDPDITLVYAHVSVATVKDLHQGRRVTSDAPLVFASSCRS
jgi:uncharacterized membrane protein